MSADFLNCNGRRLTTDEFDIAKIAVKEMLVMDLYSK